MVYSTYHRNNQDVPEWALRPFQAPQIVAEFPDHGPDCLCSWVFAPDITGTREYPFIIKHAHKLCALHGRDYYDSRGHARGTQARTQEPKARAQSEKVPAIRGTTSQGKKQPRKSPKKRRVHSTPPL